MYKRITVTSTTMFAWGALGVGIMCMAAPGAGGSARPTAYATEGASRQEVDGVVREAEIQLRQQLTSYTERVNQIQFSNMRPGQNHQGVHDNILNGFNGANKAMFRIRNEADARISRMHPAAAVQNNAVKSLETSCESNAHTLRDRYNDAMRKFNQAERRRR